MTLVRLIILYLILGCCKKFGIFYRRKKISYLKYFITDVITMTPSMTISATLTLLKSGNLNISESLNTFLHIITYFIILTLPIAFLSISISQKSRPQNPKKKKSKLNLSFHQAFYSFYKYTLLLLIPLLCSLRDRIAFFIVVSIIVGAMLANYFKSFNKLSKISKVSKAIQLFIFTTHHITFLFMFICEKTFHNTKAIQLLKYAGFIVIFTVICGGAFEIIQFVLSMAYAIFKLSSKLYKLKCMKSPELGHRIGEDAIITNLQNEQEDEIPRNLFIKAEKIDRTKNSKTKFTQSIQNKLFIKRNKKKVSKQNNKVKMGIKKKEGGRNELSIYGKENQSLMIKRLPSNTREQMYQQL